jgi:hypothetical protein
MSGAAPHPRQVLVASWVAQMIGTIVLAAVALAFVKAGGVKLSEPVPELQRYMMIAILVAAGPALYYLRTFKRRLNADEAAVRARNGIPEPAVRADLMKSLAIGGGLCELPMAFGILQLLLGGETRWFLGATLVTIAVRLSYRPFTR